MRLYMSLSHFVIVQQLLIHTHNTAVQQIDLIHTGDAFRLMATLTHLMASAAW